MTVLDNLLELLRRSRDTLCCLNDIFIRILWSKDVITTASRDSLLASVENHGSETALFALFNVISAKNMDWYGVILYAIAKQKTSFFEMITDGLTMERGISERRMEEICMDHATRFIEKHVNQYMNEKDCDILSDYCSYDDATVRETLSTDDWELLNEDEGCDVLEAFFNDDESKRVKLEMKTFQLELADQAVGGKNVIIYAPTGIGKTIVAIYIANEHLKKNPNGKVAFLVPRRHLVTQQYAAFEKFKDPDVTVLKMLSKSESSIGPLKTHLDNFQIFVMTGGIFYNALTLEDGNKLSSITQFSLIFFDECHHCMKSAPYIKVMSEYIKEKQKNINGKLPQIVGLTASPRSNNSDDRVKMKNSLLELCANLDCQEFTFVKKNVQDLSEQITKPMQEVVKVRQRQSNDFEASLLYLMKLCETKLEKMKKELYFPPAFLRLIPTDRFSQNYAASVGNLQNLQNFTVDDNDGKQKVYAIYRYLNAYYRGLIVHQLFNEQHAMESIERFLDHDGEHFSCSYDEEFYLSYKGTLIMREKTDNPAVEKIKMLIQLQLKEKPDSRILIFVRQVDYTYYMADILNTSTSVTAEAIVGSSTRNELKGCSKSVTNDLLMRFRNGEVQVLVATSVVEEGLDVPDCNMVICYGYVTNETALVQRLGRARSADSKYILLLPPMFAWMEMKENNNRRRNETMMQLIREYDQMDINNPEMALQIFKMQMKLSNISARSWASSGSSTALWQLKCKTCQRLVCTSDELRILERSHFITINPQLLKDVVVKEVKNKFYGSNKNYMIAESVKCPCNNQKLGHRIIYLGTPYIQLRITFCTVSCNGRSHSFQKWKEFTSNYPINLISPEELIDYQSKLDAANGTP